MSSQEVGFFMSFFSKSFFFFLLLFLVFFFFLDVAVRRVLSPVGYALPKFFCVPFLNQLVILARDGLQKKVF